MCIVLVIINIFIILHGHTMNIRLFLRPRRVDVKANGKRNIIKIPIGTLSSPNIVKITVVQSTECVVGAAGLHGNCIKTYLGSPDV